MGYCANVLNCGTIDIDLDEIPEASPILNKAKGLLMPFRKNGTETKQLHILPRAYLGERLNE